jgi:hypothetical protein
MTNIILIIIKHILILICETTTNINLSNYILYIQIIIQYNTILAQLSTTKTPKQKHRIIIINIKKK